jgi:hypothetical protein
MNLEVAYRLAKVKVDPNIEKRAKKLAMAR